MYFFRDANLEQILPTIMSGIRRNREILTGGKKYAQKQARKHQVDEVNFDKELRVEYLTGFHKRKLQRKKKAQKYIEEQERLHRIEERKKIREERKQDLENQLKQFDETMKRITNYDSDEDDKEEIAEDEDEEWNGIDSEEDNEKEKETTDENLPRGILRHKEIYTLDPLTGFDGGATIDDETTVTVESLENPALATVKELAQANNVNIEKSEEVLKKSIQRAKNYAVLCGVAKPEKKKKKNFRYLTKAERRENLRKEKSKSKSRRKKD